MCYQISGNKPEVLSLAVEKVMRCGADLIDLNCGCPQPKIRKKNQGSRLLSDPDYLYQLLRAMRSASTVPMSAKVRVDGGSGESFNREVAQAIESSGMDFMVVHGRNWLERYDVPVRYQDIADMVSYVGIPVIANGDVSDYSSLLRLMTETQAAGAMIARASMGKPWLFAQLQAASQGESFVCPNTAERNQLWVSHVMGLAELEGEQRALLQMRGMAKYYGFPEMASLSFTTVREFSDYLKLSTR